MSLCVRGSLEQFWHDVQPSAPTYLYTYIHTYMHTYIYTYVYIYMCIRSTTYRNSVSLSLFLSLSTSLSQHGRMSIYIYIYIFTYTHTCGCYISWLCFSDLFTGRVSLALVSQLCWLCFAILAMCTSPGDLCFVYSTWLFWLRLLGCVVLAVFTQVCFLSFVSRSVASLTQLRFLTCVYLALFGSYRCLLNFVLLSLLT